MFSKRTKGFAVLLVVCGVFVIAGGYQNFRRYREIRAEWRGQEQVMEYMELFPRPHPLVRAAFVVGVISLLAVSASAVIDIHHHHRGPQG